jgi:hypothetical protein
VARMGKERKVYRFSVGNTEGNRPLGRPRRRWEDGKVDLRGGLDSTGSELEPVASCCECRDGPSCSCATELDDHG